MPDLRALNMLGGGYCTTVDADDYVREGYIDCLTALLDKNEEYDYILLNNYLNTPGTKEFHLERPGVREKVVTDKEQLVEWVLTRGEGAIWNKIFKTSIMKQISLDTSMEKNITYGDDLLLNLIYVGRAEVRNAYISSMACYYHYVDSAISVCGNLKMKKALADYIRLNLEFDRILNNEICISNQKLLSYIMLNRIRSISKYARSLRRNQELDHNCIGKYLMEINRNLRKYRPTTIKQLCYVIDFRLMLIGIRQRNYVKRK